MADTIRIEIPIETIDNTDPELSNITKNFEKMEKAADSANNSARKANTTVTQFDKQAQKTEKSLASWAKEKYDILLEAKDKVSPILTTLGGGLKGFAGKTWSVTLKAIDLITSPVRGIINLLKNPLFQVGSVLGVSITLKDTIDTYSDFEATMSKVQALSSATDVQMAKLTQTAKDMGAVTKYSATESAEAFTYMAQAGWEVDDMIDGIGGIMSLAASDGIELAAATDIVANALTSFNMTAKDTAQFADVLAVASSATNTNVSELGEAFKYIAPTAGALGYTIEDVSLALGLMSNNAVKGSMAGTSLKTALANLAAPTDKVATAMDKYGISMTDSAGNMKSLQELLDNLRGSLGGLSEQEQTAAASTLFGKEAMSGMLGIINTTDESYAKLTEQINNAEGAADEMAETMQDNLAGAFEQLGGAVETVQLSLGERMAPYLLSLSRWIESNMPAIEDMANDVFDAIDRKAARLQDRISEMTSTQEWQDADFFGKVRIAWDELIAEPFSEWWNSTGKVKFAGFAQDIGEGIGTGLKIGVMTLLGIDLGETLDEGVSIGASFAQGFSEGFDFEAISGKLWQGFGNLLSSAGKLLPGGESADLSSVMSAALLGKIASPFISMGKGAFDIGKTIFGKGESGTSMAGNFGSWIVGSAAKGTGLKGLGATMGMTGLRLGSGATTGAGLMAAGTAATTGAIAAGATLVSGALDAYKAFKSDDAEESKAYGESAAWKAGGVAAGAAAGAALGSVIPGLGTAVGALVGAGVGGIAGWIKGNKVKEEYQENVEEMQREAEKAQKVFEATGFSIYDVTFETQALNDAINDTEVSAEELGAMFQEAVTDKLNSRFGDLKLSLKEIQEVASDLVFDKYTESINTFISAVAESESALASLQSNIQTIDKLNWRVGLGMELSEDDIDEYRTAIDGFVESAKTYVEDKQYEVTVALKLLLGDESSNYTDGLNTMYADLQSQIDGLSGQLTAQLDIALEDGVITLDEQAEIVNLQQQITDITNKVTQAEEDAQFAAIKIRYGGAGLDAESFASLQEELQSSVASMTQSYDDALEVSLTNLNLQLSEGAISQDEYNAQLQEIADGYQGQIDALQVRVESFQLEAIADAFGSELDGILPDLEGTTSEKLTQAMNNALAIEPDPATWTAEDIAGWFGLESLSAETQMAVSELLQSTAATIPQSIKEDIISAMGQASVSDIDFIGPYSQEIYGQLATLNLSEADMESLKASLSSGVATAIEGADMEKINAAIDILKGNTDASVNAAFSAGVDTTMPVNVTLDYNLLNPSKVFSVSGNGAAGSSSVTVSAHAEGGYVSGGPQLSWLAEEGYGEYVIPTNPSRRTRALEIYRQAGAALGVSAYAEGGFAGGSNLSENAADYNLFTETNRNAPLAYNESSDGDYGSESAQIYEPVSPEPQTAGGGASVNVNVSVAPEFVISGGGDNQTEENIMQVIRRHMKEMADELGGEIAGRLEEVFSNMPLKEA